MNRVIKKARSQSIYTKLTGIIIFIVLFISGAIIILSIYFSNKEIHRITQETIQSNLNINEEFISRAILEKDYWNLFKYLKALSQNSSIKEIGIIDKENHILAYSNPTKLKTGQLFQNFDNSKIVEIISDAVVIGKIVLIEDDKNIKQIIKKTFLNGLLIILIIGTVSVLISNLFLKKIIERFQIIIHNMTAITQKNWDSIKYDKTKDNDELHYLINQSVHITDEIKISIQKEDYLKNFYHSVLSSIDSLIIICDKKINIKYYNDHLLSNSILDKTTNTFKDRLYLDLIRKNIHSTTIKVENETVRYLFVNINSIDDRILINIADITKLKEAEDNDKILQSFEIVKELSSQFAHEVKNLLQPLALLLPKDKLPDKEDLPIINLTLSKMKQQVSDYLILGTSIKLDENIEYSPKTLLDELLSILKNKIEKKNLEIKIDFEENLTIFIHKKYMELVLMNLLTNAIEASFNNGEIYISWKDLNHEESLLQLENSGETIKDVSKVFKPFYTTKKEGSGLGLFTISKIIYTAQGKIEVTSKNQQTTFKIYLPKNKEYNEYSNY